MACLTRDLPESFRRDFLITHFFNPPRYMRLLEVVAGSATRPEAVEAISRFADLRLGKGVVRAKDTPGFIANRIGTYWLQTAIDQAIELGLTVEEADAVLALPVGIPKTGVFGLLDLVGIDLIPKVAASMERLLPAGDGCAPTAATSLIGRMIADGSTGRKGKGRLLPSGIGGRRSGQGGHRSPHGRLPPEPQGPAGERRRREDGRPARPGVPSRPHRPLRLGGAERDLGLRGGAGPAISDTVQGVDEAMRLGYSNWRLGRSS